VIDYRAVALLGVAKIHSFFCMGSSRAGIARPQCVGKDIPARKKAVVRDLSI